MPDVGLLSSSEPLQPEHKVVIRYSVEVNGLPVYNESYDVDQLERDLQKDEATTVRQWVRRLKCAICARKRPGFSASLTRCLLDGRCCDKGHENCREV
jgi:hypothetical protein